MKTLIDIKLLKETKPGEIIAFGTFIDGGNTNLATTGRKLNWVAVRGCIPDWTIYYEPVYSYEYSITPWDNNKIKSVGNKLPKHMAKELLEVTDEALEMYRQ